ncbi:MAG: aminoacyl-tRNA hydrolase [Clostridiales bacterium]|nr:aminoacyl-tRNA hydrolase [Clostridiales bacterium]
MLLIAGLGNPGARYAGTRHNMGFRALAHLAGRWEIPVTRTGFSGRYGQGSVDGKRVMLLAPHTYMNDSGLCVAEAVSYFRVAPADTLLLYDDIDIPCGAVRVRAQGGPGTHNGMRSVVGHLGTEDFPRVRIGVGAPPDRTALVDWVLGRPGSEEDALLEAASRRAAEAADAWARRGIDAAMNEYNR